MLTYADSAGEERDSADEFVSLSLSFSALAKSGTQLTSLSLCDNKITEVGACYLGAGAPC